MKNVIYESTNFENSFFRKKKRISLLNFSFRKMHRVVFQHPSNSFLPSTLTSYANWLFHFLLSLSFSFSFHSLVKKENNRNECVKHMFICHPFRNWVRNIVKKEKRKPQHLFKKKHFILREFWDVFDWNRPFFFVFHQDAFRRLFCCNIFIFIRIYREFYLIIPFELNNTFFRCFWKQCYF